MEAINATLLDLIAELQSLNALKDCALAGGTSLSIRFNHRVSDDIDLFTNQLIGKQGFLEIQEILAEKFRNDLLFCEIINTDLGNQFCFLRALKNAKKPQ